ncbi:MAG: MCE family protein [Azoarcus sp.]|jgi:phospholipid/cholesterol/gamma-HCH transport system substrate-binding protein|nr:MCE family protein [Azoarcus sp.]
METRAHHLLIGLFTVLAVTAALLFAQWIGGSGGNNHYVTYDVIFDEAVSGLSKGSAVEFKGIRIGAVDDLRLDPKDPRRVRARISVDVSAPIYTDTRARLHTANITGLSTIRLTAGGDTPGGGTPLNPRKGEIPVIPTEQSSLGKLINSGEDVISNVNAVLAQAQGLLSEDNLANIARTLENLERTTASLASERDSIHKTMTQLAQASAQANTMLIEAERMVTTANRLLDTQGQRAFDSAERSMASLERTMASLDKLITDNRAPLNASLAAMAELGPAVAELRTTLASLRTIARRLEERPADYLLGTEPTREFKP